MKTPLYRTEQLSLRLDYLSERLTALCNTAVKEKQAQLSRAAGALHALSPLAVLARGYAAVYQENALIKSVRDMSAGQDVVVRLHDGSAVCTVKKRMEN